MKNIFTLTAIVFLAISIQSCKKDKDSDPAPTPPVKKCRVTAATITSSSEPGVTYSFTYNNDMKVSQIISSESPVVTTTFTYSGNTVNVIKKSGTTITDKTVITTNAAGLQLRSEERDLNTDTATYFSDYEYNNSGEILKVTHGYSNSDPTITNCSYTDGNMISMSSSGIIANLEYYTDQSFRSGDYLHLIQFLESGNTLYIVNKNLVKSLIQGSSITNFNYTFDTDNNIIQMDVINGSDIMTVDFQQVCE